MKKGVNERVERFIRTCLARNLKPYVEFRRGNPTLSIVSESGEEVPDMVIQVFEDHSDEVYDVWDRIGRPNETPIYLKEMRELGREFDRDAYRPAERNPYYPDGYETPEERNRREVEDEVNYIAGASERAAKEADEYLWGEGGAWVTHGLNRYHFEPSETGGFVCSCKAREFHSTCKHEIARRIVWG